MDNIVAISELRNNLPSLIDEVGEGLKRLIVTVSGKPKAVVMSVEEMESLEETAEVLAEPGILKTLESSKKQIRKGQYITLKELEEKYCGQSYSVKRGRKRL